MSQEKRFQRQQSRRWIDGGDCKIKEIIMAKLCPRGKAAAKRKFKVYPSAYANMYASAVCSGKVTPGGKKNRKKKMGGGMAERGLGRAFMKGGRV